MTADLPISPDPPPASEAQAPRARHSLFVVLIFLPLLVALGLFIYQQVLIANKLKQERDQHNILRMMDLGFVNYCVASQSLMPSSFNDSQGNALYSWRLWMPAYIGGNGFEIERVVWNDPRMVMRVNNTLFPGPNATAHPKSGQTASREFGLYCFYPDPKTGLRTTTNILAITGPDSPIRDLQSVGTKPLFNLQELKDLPPDTYRNLIVFMEVFDSGVHWMEPVDLVVRDNQLTLRGQPFEIKVPDWARGFHIAFPDYATWLLDKKTPVDALIPLMKISTAGKYDRDKHLAPYILNKYPQR